VKVQMKGKHAFVGNFLEYGVKPHEIEPKRKGGLKLAEDVVRGAVHHPGFGEMPFMRPALDTKGAEAVAEMGSYVRSRLSWGQLQAPQVGPEVDEDDE
jgi:hypothetical protein